MNRLSGKIALITGGGGGIGAATAILFAEEGAHLALVDNNAAATETVANEIRHRFPSTRVLPIVTDLRRKEETDRCIAMAHQHFGNLDILVNVAGVRVYGPLADADASSWELILAVNLMATANCCKAAIPIMRKQAGGSIINVSSVFGITGRPGMGQYDVTKAAVVSLSRTMAIEEAANGIRVNSVCPGPTLTPFHVERAKEKGQTEEELRESGAKHSLLKRWAEPREVAYPILFLASDESSYVTGTALVVDGGVSATSMG
jgi:2-hydroxycyclohexanecarboxyl-CoA dehydrogenase